MTAMMSPRALRFRFVAAICAGSFLLFLVQPMVARMALPRLGGAPAVWNSAMLVYQALLLGGYAYAHFIGRFAPRVQAYIHVALLVAAASMLPIGLIAATPSVTANPFLWVPYLFLASIGPLFFVIAAQAPLLQRWFALSGGGDPYPLYAASNLGSFGGLIAYPLVVEPLLPLKGQSVLWSLAYGAVILLVALCALRLPKANAPVAAQSRIPIAPRTMVMWIALSAVPSGLMLSTSTHLTTDIVAMPLLWVVPLGLYLLSFSIAFAEKRGLANAILAITPLVLMIGGGTAFANNASIPWLYAPLGLWVLFVVSVGLHTMLYDRRPDPSRLTMFYLAMSAGGVLGGLFCALIAPLLFDWAYEHPILIVAAALLVAQQPIFSGFARLRPSRTLLLGVIAILASMVAGRMLGIGEGAVMPEWATLVLLLVGIVVAIIVMGRRIPFAMALTAIMLTIGGWQTIKTSLHRDGRVRSFFGIYTIANAAGQVRFLQHGTTMHGEQSLMPGREREPLTYYAPKSGVGLAMAAAPQLFAHPARIGIVGLGAGTLACYAQPGQDWRFYEIDPAIVDIARNPKDFTFLANCLPKVLIEIGDARLTIAADPRHALDLLVIDAFSSDAVPMHLLTKEALETYANRLDTGGLLMIHISNRFMALEPVLAAAEGYGWHTLARTYVVSPEDAAKSYSSSLWIALARDKVTLDRLATLSGMANWRPTQPRAGFAGWTDDYASILPLLKWSNDQ
jgi:hypothetical protein